MTTNASRQVAPRTPSAEELARLHNTARRSLARWNAKADCDKTEAPPLNVVSCELLLGLLTELERLNEVERQANAAAFIESLTK